LGKGAFPLWQLLHRSYVLWHDDGQCLALEAHPFPLQKLSAKEYK
jgi:hypothetical protein